jgi:hypothetical protein
LGLIKEEIDMSQADNLAALATNVNSSGVLQPAGGGTGTSTSTGTGSVVLSNSPTLVTPVLGSASATQLTTALGSAAAPAFTFSGDTNTGIFSPAADTIAFSEGGVESMRITSAGNLGIGLTNPTQKLEVTGNIKINGGVVAGERGTAAAPAFSFSDNLNSGMFNISNLDLGFATAGTERMRIDSSGRVGIGTSSPDTTTLLTVAGAVTITGANSGHGASRLKLGQDTTAISQLRFYGADNSTAGILQFTGSSADGNVGGERMRIDSSGNVIVGATAQIGSARFGVQRSGAGEAIRWTDGATGGAITTVASFGTNLNSDALSFTTSSTERLRIASNGAFGLSGANYGTAGQVLTSNGSGSAPSWATAGGGVTSAVAGNGVAVSGSTGAVTFSVSAPTFNSIGSYAGGSYYSTGAFTISPGSTVTGGTFGTNNRFGVEGTTISGSWRAMSYAMSEDGGYRGLSCVRIS